MSTEAATSQRLGALQSLLYREVPISRHMEVAAETYDGQMLTLSAALEPNINIHATAFGGSMYSLAALAGWALLRLRLEDLSLDAEIVVGSATIDYRRPVRSRLFARAGCSSRDFDAFAERIRGRKRASVEIAVAVGSVEGPAWQEAARFRGKYATA